MIAQYLAIGLFDTAGGGGGGAVSQPVARRTARIVGIGTRLASFNARS